MYTHFVRQIGSAVGLLTLGLLGAVPVAADSSPMPPVPSSASVSVSIIGTAEWWQVVVNYSGWQDGDWLIGTVTGPSDVGPSARAVPVLGHLPGRSEGSEEWRAVKEAPRLHEGLSERELLHDDYSRPRQEADNFDLSKEFGGSPSSARRQSPDGVVSDGRGAPQIFHGSPGLGASGKIERLEGAVESEDETYHYSPFLVSGASPSGLAAPVMSERHSRRGPESLNSLSGAAVTQCEGRSASEWRGKPTNSGVDSWRLPFAGAVVVQATAEEAASASEGLTKQPGSDERDARVRGRPLTLASVAARAEGPYIDGMGWELLGEVGDGIAVVAEGDGPASGMLTTWELNPGTAAAESGEAQYSAALPTAPATAVEDSDGRMSPPYGWAFAVCLVLVGLWLAAYAASRRSKQ